MVIPVFDTSTLLTWAKNVALKLATIPLYTFSKLFKWGVIAATVTLAFDLFIIIYNAFHDFKLLFEAFISNHHDVFDVAIAAGALKAFTDLFSLFFVLLTAFIIYVGSTYVMKLAEKLDGDFTDSLKLANQ